MLNAWLPRDPTPNGVTWPGFGLRKACHENAKGTREPQESWRLGNRGTPPGAPCAAGSALARASRRDPRVPVLTENPKEPESRRNRGESATVGPAHCVQQDAPGMRAV